MGQQKVGRLHMSKANWLPIHQFSLQVLRNFCHLLLPSSSYQTNLEWSNSNSVVECLINQSAQTVVCKNGFLKIRICGVSCFLLFGYRIQGLPFPFFYHLHKGKKLFLSLLVLYNTCEDIFSIIVSLHWHLMYYLLCFRIYMCVVWPPKCCILPR